MKWTAEKVQDLVDRVNGAEPVFQTAEHEKHVPFHVAYHYGVYTTSSRDHDRHMLLFFLDEWRRGLLGQSSSIAYQIEGEG